MVNNIIIFEVIAHHTHNLIDYLLSNNNIYIYINILFDIFLTVFKTFSKNMNVLNKNIDFILLILLQRRILFEN